MAPTLSNTDHLEADWEGKGVTIGQVLSELNGIRKKFAHAEAGDADQPHPRNQVMTLVAVAANEHEERRARRASMAIATHHPSLAIVVRDQPHLQRGHIDASITTHTHQPATAKKIQFELVTLHVSGAAGEHLAALVDPLLLSGVPTYLWWLGTPPFGTAELVDALRICDALVVDSAHFERPFHSFTGLANTAAHAHKRLGLADFQWARLAPWRETIAMFFAPEERRAFMTGVGEVGIDYVGVGRGNRVAAALLLGWLASAVGWKLRRAVGGAGGIVSAQFASEGWRTVDVQFRSVPKARIAQGEVSAIRIGGAAGGKTFRLSMEREPERAREVSPDVTTSTPFQSLHRADADHAGEEIAQRQAVKHREIAFENRESLHHTATGDPPGESLPPHPTVFVRDRRRENTASVLLTLIEIGDMQPLRHVQQVESMDEAALLLDLLSTGAHDPVHARSLGAAADLMRAL